MGATADLDQQKLLSQVSLLKEQLEEERRERNADRERERSSRAKEAGLREDLQKELSALRKSHTSSAASLEAAERRSDIMKRQLDETSKRAVSFETALFGKGRRPKPEERGGDVVGSKEMDPLIREASVLRQELKGCEEDARWQREADNLASARIAKLERGCPAGEREAALRTEVMMLRDTVDAMRQEAWAARARDADWPQHPDMLRLTTASLGLTKRDCFSKGARSPLPVQRDHLPTPRLQRLSLLPGVNPRLRPDASKLTLTKYGAVCFIISFVFAYFVTPQGAADQQMLSQGLITLSTFLVVFSMVAGFAFPLHSAMPIPNHSHGFSASSTPRSPLPTLGNSRGGSDAGTTTPPRAAAALTNEGDARTVGMKEGDARRLSSKERLEALQREAYGEERTRTE